MCVYFCTHHAYRVAPMTLAIFTASGTPPKTLDFTKKAFDTVPHKRLLVKLHYYGIHGPLHDWINNWLIGRYQKIIIEGESSRDIKVYSGVPQVLS